MDPHYLSWKMRTLDYRARFIELAAEVNAQMPRFVVGKVQEALNRKRQAVRDARILVLGVAYKADVNDIRESPALDVMEHLKALGARVAYHDPYVPELPSEGGAQRSLPLTDQVLAEADCVVLVTAHSAFDLGRIFRHAATLVDARNATGKLAAAAGEGLPQRWIVKESPQAASSMSGAKNL